MRTRRKYDRQFKIDSVELLEKSRKATKEVADELGIAYDVLSRWRRELTEKDKKAFPGKGNPRDEELVRLRKENADLKMEREILKKALAIFSTTGK